MSDAIINSVEMSPAVPTVLPTQPGVVPAVDASAANDTPKPGSREAKKTEREAKKKAEKEARAKTKAAKQEARDAEKVAKQKEREARAAQAELNRQLPKQEKPVRAESSPEVWRATFLAVAAEASGVDDPIVAQVLKEAEHGFSAFQKDVSEQPASATKLANMKAADQDLYAVMTEDLELLVHGVLSVRGGKELVKAAKDSDKVTMARQLIGRVTPHHLGHNGYQLEALKKSLAEYEAVHQSYDDLKRESDLASARITEGKRLVQLAVSLLQSAIAMAGARKALADERKAQAQRHLHMAKAA